MTGKTEHPTTYLDPASDRHVSISVTLKTGGSIATIALAVTQAIEKIAAHPGVIQSVHAYDLDAPGDEPQVQAVILTGDAPVSGGSLGPVFVDAPERAEEFAKNTGGVLVDLPVAGDYRRTGSERETSR